MSQIVVQPSIVLKQSTAQSSALPSSAKRTLAAGVYPIKDCTPSAAGHFVVTFLSPLVADDGQKSYWSWWLYEDDRVILPAATATNKVLKVEYASQLDNAQQPHRTCNTSCCWMLLNYLKPGARKSDDDYWRLDVNPLGDTTDHGIQTRALARHGIKSEFKYDLDFDDIYKSLAKGNPVVIGIAHRGPQAAPSGGHMILVIGRDGNNLICHDPFGRLPYSDWSSGKSVSYSASMLSSRWLLDGKGSGWGRIVL